MDLTIRLTKRTRRRTNRDGSVVEHERYVLNFRDPTSRKRRQLFFDRKRDAEAAQRDIMVKADAAEFIELGRALGADPYALMQSADVCKQP